MNRVRNLILLLLLLALNLTSCLVSDSARTLHIEIMKPGLITIPVNFDTIVVVNRYSNIKDTIPFKYFDGKTIVTDTTIKYSAVSNICVKALADFFKGENYFKEVINPQDSLSNVFLSNKSISYPEEIFRKTKSNICIILNYFSFSVAAPYGLGDVSSNMATLSWEIAIKNDSLIYLYNQRDTLIYDPMDFPMKMDDHKKLQFIVNGSSNYLGRFAGSKIIPNWMPVERLYYKSDHPDMLLAEKYALQNDWLRAAEPWNRLSNNKNKKIAAKAGYNMALACEMEGKHDLAIDWLVKSFSILNGNDAVYKKNCQRYIAVLTQRKKELEKLAKQVWNN